MPRLQCAEKMKVGRRRLAVAAVALAASAPGYSPAQARQEEPPDRSLAELRQELESLRRSYEERLSGLEERVRELEADAAKEVSAAEEGVSEDRAADLRAAARAALEAEGERQATVPEVTSLPPAGARSLNRLNPEISFTGDVLAVGGEGEEDFEDREFELDLQAVLDPYSRTKWTLAFSPEEGVEVEEGYILYSGLREGLELKGGKFRQQFGPLNRVHLHALPQVDYPTVLTAFLGEEALAQTGVALNWLLRRPWASANEVTLEVTDGSAEPFGGDSFDRLVVLARLKNFWDLDEATYLEWGLTGVSGRPAGSRSTEVLGTDLTLSWRPPARARSRGVTWRTEVLRSRRDDGSGRMVDALGGYSYLEGLIGRNLSLGLRYDWVEDPLDPGTTIRGLFPYLSWWQSEFVRLRGQFAHVEHDESGAAENRFTLQLTWAAGPHKHEEY